MNAILSAKEATEQGEKSASGAKDKDKDKEKDKVRLKPDEMIISRSEFKGMFDSFVKVDEALMERLFIIQVALEDGWATAKDVAFYKSGWQP